MSSFRSMRNFSTDSHHRDVMDDQDLEIGSNLIKIRHGHTDRETFRYTSWGSQGHDDKYSFDMRQYEGDPDEFYDTFGSQGENDGYFTKRLTVQIMINGKFSFVGKSMGNYGGFFNLTSRRCLDGSFF